MGRTQVMQLSRVEFHLLLNWRGRSMSRFFKFGVANGSTEGSFSFSTSTSLMYSLENLISRFKGFERRGIPLQVFTVHWLISTTE